MTWVQGLGLAGIVLNLAGVILLFRYGIPYRVELKGAILMAFEETDHEGLAAERRYKTFGFIGLALIVLGSALQGAAVLLA